MSKEPWFRARTGLWSWGWTPVTWQGWLVTLGGALAIAVINLAVIAYVSLNR
ncbi:hypothetical protein [Phenylobacterium sp.]|jgi:hypothetical protein|uniref:hypothetical protein n=1 Tax=Phenylobacterium sp. TaxID=1871053 RepID=UPI002F3FCAB5